MKKFDAIKMEKEENIGVITIDRPPVNALNEATLQELDESINEFQEDEEVRVLIITGGGEKAFSAGADLKEFGISFQSVFNRVERCKKPVLAAINGYALGGGCELAMACHFRIMAENATIGLTEINRGLIPGGGGTQRMPRLIGRAKALELLLLGEKLEADEALDIGLVNEVSKDGELSPMKEKSKKITERSHKNTIGDCGYSDKEKYKDMEKDKETEYYVPDGTMYSSVYICPEGKDLVFVGQYKDVKGLEYRLYRSVNSKDCKVRDHCIK